MLLGVAQHLAVLGLDAGVLGRSCFSPLTDFEDVILGLVVCVIGAADTVEGVLTRNRRPHVHVKG